MQHTIPYTNWTMKLADAIQNAQDGDEIICHTAAMLELAERAHARMCPDKKLTFTLEDQDESRDVFAFR